MATPLRAADQFIPGLAPHLGSETLYQFVAFGLLGMYPAKPTAAEAMHIKHFVSVHLSRGILEQAMEMLKPTERALFVLSRHGLSDNQRPVDRDILARSLGLSNGTAHRWDNQCSALLCDIFVRLLGSTFARLPGQPCLVCPTTLTLLTRSY
jgi:hypothetical protein